MNRVFFRDCRDTMRDLIAQGVKVQCCVTSPPYFGLRDYGHPGQIGLEQTPADYVAAMVEVFGFVRELLADDGVLWLNLGDSYASQPSWGRGGGSTLDGRKQGKEGGASADRTKLPGLKPKDLIGIPWRVAFALQADGWYLRQDIIWHKPNPMPESVTDRCTKAHEYLFLLTKRARYYWDAEAMKEDCIKGAAGSEFHTGKTGEHQLGRASKRPRTAGNKNHKYVEAYEGSETEELRTKAGLMKIADVPWERRNRRSVWTVATVPYTGAHFATFPPALIEPCILAGSRPGDTVLDPFFGSGTTGEVAGRFGRQWIGCELNQDYEPLQIARTAQSGLPL